MTASTAFRPLALPTVLYGHVHKLWKNGILVQAVGIPVRHALALWGLTRILRGMVSWRTGLFSIGMWMFSGLGVTAGVHRLWTHQAYKPHPIMESLLMIMFSTADQGAIMGWALTHAMHHTSSDLPGDPHNRVEGFWHSHFGWIFSTKQNRITHWDYHKVLGGLGPIVHFHDRVCVLWDPFWSLVMPGIVASLWGEFGNGFFVAGAVRWFCVQHITFFVNSVAHGERDGDSDHAFDKSAAGIGPRVSYLVSFLALGEGWHEYHHLFPWDYAAAELGALDQWNPTKFFIDSAANLGLVKDRRRCSSKLQALRRQQLLDQTYDDLDLDAADRVKFEPKGIKGPIFFRHRVMAPVNESKHMSKACRDRPPASS